MSDKFSTKSDDIYSCDKKKIYAVDGNCNIIEELTGQLGSIEEPMGKLHAYQSEIIRKEYEEMREQNLDILNSGDTKNILKDIPEEKSIWLPKKNIITSNIILPEDEEYFSGNIKVTIGSDGKIIYPSEGENIERFKPGTPEYEYFNKTVRSAQPRWNNNGGASLSLGNYGVWERYRVSAPWGESYDYRMGFSAQLDGWAGWDDFKDSFRYAGFDTFAGYDERREDFWSIKHETVEIPGYWNGLLTETDNMYSQDGKLKYTHWINFKEKSDTNGSQVIYDYDRNYAKLTPNDSRLNRLDVEPNSAMTWYKHYAAMKGGEAVLIRAWFRIRGISNNMPNGSKGYLYQGYRDFDNNQGGNPHEGNNDLKRGHTFNDARIFYRRTPIYMTHHKITENRINGKLIIYKKAQITESKQGHYHDRHYTYTDWNGFGFRVVILMYVDNQWGMPTGDHSYESHVANGAKIIYENMWHIGNMGNMGNEHYHHEWFDINLKNFISDINPHRARNLRFRTYYRMEGGGQNFPWNATGPMNLKYEDIPYGGIDTSAGGQIMAFPKTKINSLPSTWLAIESKNPRKDNACLNVDIYTNSTEPDGQEFNIPTIDLSFENTGGEAWYNLCNSLSGGNGEKRKNDVELKWISDKLWEINNNIDYSRTIGKLLQSVTYIYDGFNGLYNTNNSDWQNGPTQEFGQYTGRHQPRFDMRPPNVEILVDKTKGDVFTVTLRHDYPLSGCRYFCIVSRVDSNSDPIAQWVVSQPNGVWYDASTQWQQRLDNWVQHNSFTFDLNDFEPDQRGQQYKIVGCVVSPYGWDTEISWRDAGAKTILFNEYPEAEFTGVHTNANYLKQIIPPNTVQFIPDYTQTTRDNHHSGRLFDNPAGKYIVISGFIECTQKAATGKTATIGIKYTASDNNDHWAHCIQVDLDKVYNNKCYFDAIYSVSSTHYKSGLMPWTQVGIGHGESGYSVKFTELRYEMISQPSPVDPDTLPKWYNTGDIIQCGLAAEDVDGIQSYSIMAELNNGMVEIEKYYNFNSDKPRYYSPNVDLKLALTDRGEDYKKHVGESFRLWMTATDKLGASRDILQPTDYGASTVIFDYKPTLSYTLSSTVGTSTVITVNTDSNYTAGRKYEIQITKKVGLSWKRVYLSPNNTSTGQYSQTIDPGTLGYPTSDRGQVFQIRARVYSKTGAFISDWITKEFTWGAAPTITLNSVVNDYDYKTGVVMNGRFGTKATFNYTVVTTGTATIEIKGTINGTTKTLLTKSVASGTTNHSDLINFKTFFDKNFTDYDMTFAIHGTAYGLSSIVNNTNDYGTKGKIIYLEPMQKPTPSLTAAALHSKLVGTVVHGSKFKTTTTSSDNAYSKCRVNNRKLKIYRGVAGTAEATKTLIATITIDKSLTTLNHIIEYSALDISLSKGTEYKYKVDMEVYYFGNSTNPAFITQGDWSTNTFRYTPDATTMKLTLPINCTTTANALPCRKPTLILTIPAQSEEGNKEINRAAIHWNGAWIYSNVAQTNYDNLATNLANRVIKFYPPDNINTVGTLHNIRLSICSKLTETWSETSASIMVIDPVSIKRTQGTLIDIFLQPRTFIDNLRRAYGLSNYSYPAITTGNTPISKANLLDCLSASQNEVVTKINSYAGTKKLANISYTSEEFINAARTTEVYDKLIGFAIKP